MSNRQPRITDGWGSGKFAIDTAAFFGVRMFRNLDFWMGSLRQKISSLIFKTSPSTPAKAKDSVILQTQKDRDLTGRDTFVQGLEDAATFTTGTNTWRIEELWDLSAHVLAKYSGSSGFAPRYKKAKLDLFLDGTKPFIGLLALVITPSGTTITDNEYSEADPHTALATNIGDDQKVVIFPEVCSRPFYPGSTTPHYRAEIGINMVPILNQISKLCDEAEFNANAVPQFSLVTLTRINDSTNGKTVNWKGQCWTSWITQAR